MDANSFLMGGGKSVKFDDKGDTVTGVIISPPEVAQQRDYKTKELAYWDDDKTQPKMQMIITLRTNETDPEDPEDDGERRLFVASPNMRKAIASAVRSAKRKGLAVGGVLRVTYTENGQKQHGQGFPPKLYTAQYVPPNEEVAVPEQPKAEASAAESKAAATPDELGPEAAAALQNLFGGK